ncbi:MAG: hypothetical protein GC184_03845 [Rhizobiales bacterium]|nr:hypothetical protein [Hyphomicrobiales bacterium]
MRPSEAKFIFKLLKDFPVTEITPCLNLGSSTGNFRTIHQPHIQEQLIGPLEDMGVKFLHSDFKEAEGVDIAGDIYDNAVLTEIKSRNIRSVLCCNMFEHVIERDRLAAIISDIVPKGGLLLVSVPYSYPLHYDPIDTYFRPSPEEIAKLFPEFRIEKSGIVSDITFSEELYASFGIAGFIWHVLKSAIKFFMFWRGAEKWKGHMHRYLWLFRPYQSSCAVLRKQ